jgi:hypothetical protein
VPPQVAQEVPVGRKVNPTATTVRSGLEGGTVGWLTPERPTLATAILAGTPLGHAASAPKPDIVSSTRWRPCWSPI